MNLVEQLGLADLDDQLPRVELALDAAVSTADPFMTEVAGHLGRAGGKRLRPMLALASAHAAGAAMDDRVVQAGVSVELCHLGSLYHDDVIDDADQRRGVQSVNARWGNLVAILVGDFLLARASELAAGLGAEMAELLARTIGDLCRGEVAQLRTAFDPDRSEAAYLDAIAGKTASLTATACRMGSSVTGAPAAVVDALTTFGHAYGMTFQVWDDILDLTATGDELGKPAGHDMVEGTYTLPVIRALALPGTGDELRALLGGPIDEPTRDKARDLILDTDAVSSAVTEARRWADRAADALAPLSQGSGAAAAEMLAGAGHRLLDGLSVT